MDTDNHGLDAPCHGEAGIKVGFEFTAVLMVVGSVLWLIGSRFLQHDTELAPRRVTDAAGGFPVVESE